MVAEDDCVVIYSPYLVEHRIQNIPVFNAFHIIYIFPASSALTFWTISVSAKIDTYIIGGLILLVFVTKQVWITPSQVNKRASFQSYEQTILLVSSTYVKHIYILHMYYKCGMW